MHKLFVYIFILSAIYFSCASTSNDSMPVKIPTTVRDSDCTSCMSKYIDSFPKMGDDSVLGMWARYTTLPDDYQSEEIGTPHEREKVYILIYIKRVDTVVEYIYSLTRRSLDVENDKIPYTIEYPPSYIKQKGDWTIYSTNGNWQDEDYSFAAINFKTREYGHATGSLKVRYVDTSRYTSQESKKSYITYYKPINTVKEVLLPLWQYSQRCAQNDTNTLGRWYGPVLSCIRIFKMNNKYYEERYWADGKGTYFEVKLEHVPQGIKVIPVYEEKDLEKVFHHYKIIDFKNDYTLKHYIGSKNRLDDSFFFEPCYKYCEAETDSMFYYGYDTLSHLIKREEPILFDAQE